MIYLREIGSYNSAVLEFSASKSLKSLGGRLCCIEFDIYLSYAGSLSATARRARDLQFFNYAVLGAFILYIFTDF